MSKEQQKKHIINMMEKDQELWLYEESKYPLCDCERPDYFCDCLLYDEKIKEEPKQEIKLEDIFNDEKRQGVKDLIDKHKQDDENYLDSFGVTKTQFEVYRNFNKQETFEEAVNAFKKTDVYINEIKQETLEEAARELFLEDELWSARHIFSLGAKWQQERMYSEEDMNDYANYRLLIKKALSPKEWFKQFKNK